MTPSTSPSSCYFPTTYGVAEPLTSAPRCAVISFLFSEDVEKPSPEQQAAPPTDTDSQGQHSILCLGGTLSESLSFLPVFPLITYSAWPAVSQVALCQMLLLEQVD